MPEGPVVYEGGLPLGRQDAHDPDLALDVTARGGVVYLNLSVQSMPSFAQLAGVLSPEEAFELSFALREAAAVAQYGWRVPPLPLVTDGAVAG